MRSLMAHGAKVDAKGDEGETAFWFAAQQGHLDAMKLLIENGADPSVVARGQNAAEAASEGGHTEVLEYLKGLGVGG
jgi:ankyrin repeat protein